jgi:UDP-GlcNAc:undecaprenyl-phosphate GlcNAc-1-phosphate transferase
MLTQEHSPLSPVLPLIVLGFPILDTLAVMAERISEGRSPFSADKNHFHHRLLRLGLYQTEAVFSIYVIQALLIIFAWLFRFYSEWFLLLSYALFAVLVVGFFTIADRTGWTLKRFDIIDRGIKGHLRKLRGKWLAIRISFRAVYFGLPALLVFLALLPAAIPSYFSILSAFLASVLALVWLLRKEWLGAVFMLCLYVFIPLLVYSGEVGAAEWVPSRVVRIHYLLYVVLAFFSVTTHMFTRRKKGFRITPMDFIVVVLALAVAVLPREIVPEEAVKKVIPMIITLFFGYEVLTGELRGNIERLTAVTIGALLIVAIRGIV